VQDPSNPQTLNRYAYAGNNPVVRIDPSGRAWFIPFIIAAAKGAAIGATVGAATSAVMGGDIGRGALFGAIGGAVFAGMGSLPQSLTRLATVPGGIGPMTAGASMTADILGGILGGASAGAAMAAYNKSDVGRGALSGGVFGAASLVGIPNFQPFGKGKLGSIFNRFSNTGVTGASLGALQQGVIGGDILEGAKRGGLSWMTGEGFNMAVGHTIGFIASGLKAPDFKDGAFFYDAGNWDGFITFSNVVTGPYDAFNKPFLNMDGIVDPQGRTFKDHEFGHMPQGTLLGPTYIPAHIASMTLGTIYGLPSLKVDGHHRYGFLETYWHDVPSYWRSQ
jgi:hypothetical protein